MEKLELSAREALVKEIVRVRQEQHLTQSQLAQKIGIQQSNVSRLERGHSNPSIEFIEKVAKGLGCKLKIEFVECELQAKPKSRSKSKSRL